MSDLTILAHFTKNVGDDPATGLTLTDIALYLTSIDRITGAEVEIWDGTQNPAFEVSNTGAYGRIYDVDFDTYNYSGGARYNGATVLDNDWVSGTIGEGITFGGDMGTEDDFFLAILVTHKNNPTGTSLVTVQENIYCSAIDQFSRNVWAQEYPTEKLHLMRQTHTKYTAFAAGDYLVHDGLTYAIRAIHPYDAQGGLDAFYSLVLEEQSGS